MLPISTPAKFITLLYHDTPVRIHIHTDDKSIWVVLHDLCNVIHRKNPSYYKRKLPINTWKIHKIKTIQGYQKVIWVKVQNLPDIEDSLYLGEFLLWVQTTVNSDVLGSDNPTKVFKDPVLVEKEDLKNLLEITAKLYQNLSLL